MEGGCCGQPQGETLVFTCAGAAYTGQLANRAGVQMIQQGAGRLFCMAAVAAGISDKLERARQGAARVVIDGCEDRCCRKVLEKAGLPVDVHVVVTDLGIEKQPSEPRLVLDTKRVVERAIEALRAPRQAPGA